VAQGSQPELRNLAFYYPNPWWHDADWVKNLILFFDGVALLVPEYMKERPFEADPAIAAGLQENGLLEILKPEEFVDKAATEKLASALTDIITSGALDHLTKESTRFHELSYSRLGGQADAGLAAMIFEELKKRGLAKDSEDGVSIPMHPMVRSLVLVLLAQILRPAGANRGLDLSPATDRPEIVAALTELLDLPAAPSAGHVVSLDLQTVSVDLGRIPLDEVLGFRAAHRDQYQRYARKLRRFVRELGQIPPAEQAEALDERQAEISAEAEALRQLGRRAWRKPASFVLGLAGAAWRASSGDIVGALVAASAGVAGADFAAPKESEAYSYLFRAHSRFAP